MDTRLMLIVLGTYLVILIAIGFYASRKAKSAKGFFIANRELGTLLCTATITATVVGGSATIAAGGLIYSFGLPGLWLDIGGALGLIALGLILAKKVRKTGLFTLPEITGHLFDEKVRWAAAILIIITEIAWVSLLIQSSGLILSIMVPMDFKILLIIISAVFIAYTLIGGQYAVVYTDLIQFIVMLIGVCFVAAPLLWLDAAPDLGQLSANKLSFPVNADIGVLTALSFFFMMFMPHVVGPDIYSKILSAKSEKVAKRAAIFSGLLRLIFAIAIGMIALSAIVLHPELENPHLAIPTAVANLSPILAGLVLAAFISVMLSSADSCLLSAGTILSVDITRKNSVNISRIGILLVGTASLFLSLLYMGDILDTLKLAYTVFTAGLTMPIIFGFYKEKTGASSTGAFWSLILGGAISLICMHTDTSFTKYAVLVGLLVSVVPLIVFREAKK